MKAVVLGAGVISGGHCEELKNFGYELLAIVDPIKENRENFQKEYGFKYAFADYKEALGIGADLAMLCTPNAFHCEAAVDFLHDGANVICEKPMARTVAECDKMIAAAKETGKRLFISHSQQLAPMHRKMIDKVRAGEIGKPFMAKAEFIGNEFNRMNNPANWKGTKEISGGGVLIDNGVHMINLLVAMFGKAEKVIACCDKLVVEAANKLEDTAEIIIRFENGVMATVSVTFAARTSAWPSWYCGAAFRTEVYGTEGSVVSGNDLPNFILRKLGEEPKPENNDTITDVRDMTDYFLRCIEKGEESIITTQDARHCIAIVEAAYKSQKENRWVALSEIG